MTAVEKALEKLIADRFSHLKEEAAKFSDLGMAAEDLKWVDDGPGLSTYYKSGRVTIQWNYSLVPKTDGQANVERDGT